MNPTKHNLKKISSLLRAYAESNLENWIKSGNLSNYGICMDEARELESLIELPMNERRNYL